jgi:hypothetical protein
MSVVDLLEVVEIEGEEGHGRSAPEALSHGLLERVGQQRTVVEARERVRDRLGLERALLHADHAYEDRGEDAHTRERRRHARRDR